jgi:LacI family transcriptional regulator
MERESPIDALMAAAAPAGIPFASIVDIAREAGVHASTVSRALDPNSQTSLTDAVAERVRAAAKRLDYRPNRLAAGLRINRTWSVGVVIPDITNALFPPIVRGIESVLEPLGYASIFVNTDNIPERENRLIDVLRERGVDGIISGAARRVDPKISEVADAGIPIVTLNRKVDNQDIPYVISDEKQGIRMILRYLHDLGHTRLAHIAGPQGLSTGQLRLAAFCEASAELGLEFDETTIAISRRFDEEEGYRCSEYLLNANPEITAILCANDRLALGAMKYLQSRGLRCPEDISVTGFNDMSFLDLLPVRLTTIRIQQFELGKAAATILLNLINKSAEKAPRETVLPVELMVRDSAGPPLHRTASGPFPASHPKTEAVDS